MMMDQLDVRYICQICSNYNTYFYYRQQFLKENKQWGSLRPITKKTFFRRKKEGYPVQVVHNETLPSFIAARLNDLENMIDLALDRGDKDWFIHLCQQKEELFSQ